MTSVWPKQVSEFQFQSSFDIGYVYLNKQGLAVLVKEQSIRGTGGPLIGRFWDQDKTVLIEIHPIGGVFMV